jgi:hypothetical protein
MYLKLESAFALFRSEFDCVKGVAVKCKGS